MPDEDDLRSKENEGRCVSCGFLSRDTESHESGRPEVTSASRRTGRFGSGWFPEPMCSREVADLCSAALAEPTPQGSDTRTCNPSQILAVIRKDRKCPSWFQYEPLHSPKEHAEMQRMIEIEKMRQENARILAEMEREQRISAEKIQADSVKIAEATKGLTGWGVFLAGVMVFLTVVAICATVYFGTRPVAPTKVPVVNNYLVVPTPSGVAKVSPTPK